jgi:predicted MFS family arabinose efflux permease
MVPREKLYGANALSSASWSVMLSIGAWIGGMVTSGAGPRAAFLLDAATFLVSAVYIFRAKVPPLPKADEGAHAGHGSFLDGLRYLRAHPPQAVVVFLKGGLGVVGGFGVLLSAFADQVLGGDLARSTGWLYFARGLGALLGPLVAKRFFGDGSRSLRRGLLVSFPLAATALVGFAYAPTLGAACAAFVLTTTGTSIVWVHSTQLLQLTVEERVLGRVLAVELAVLTGALAASTALVAVPMAQGWLDPRGATLLLSASMLVPAVAWVFANARWGDAIDRAVAARNP